MSEPKRTGLLELLRASQGAQFVIPVYQRNYTWDANDQAKQYLNDLESVMKGDYKNHFLGIIIYLEKTIDYSAREFSVIDGQQRLTTTFLLIYAVKKLLEQNGEIDKVNQIEGQFLTNPYSADNIKYKLKPLVSDDDVYRCIVENRIDEIDNLSSNVLKNFNAISTKIKTWIESGYTPNDILLAMDRLYVVCVPISEEDNAQKIFESINATGAKLTSADLIRNYLLMDLKSDVQESYYAKYWKRLEDNVSADSKQLEMFFRMFLAIKTYTLVAKNAVYREFMAWTDKKRIDTKSLFEELLEYAKIFNYLLNGEISSANSKLKDALTDFRKQRSELPLAMLMEFVRLFRGGHIGEETLGELIYSVNSYLIRRAICDINSQNISKLFPTILKRIIDKCQDNFDDIVEVLNQEMVGKNVGTSGSYMPTDRQMHEMLHFANVYKRPALRIILDRMELYDNPAPVDLSKLSVEHLMPQKPTAPWLEELDTDIEQYNENLHRIGNLTLATKPDNSKMSNATWDYKNEVLKETAHLTMNIELMDIDRWDLNQIEKRTARLIKKICELYPYPDITIEEDDEDIIDDKTAVDISLTMIGRDNVVAVKKGSVYRTLDNKKGYVITTSKMYPQGEKEKYWFGYRDKRFNPVNECEEQYYVLSCKYHNAIVIQLPKSFIESIKDRLNISIDAEGEVSHYHIVVFNDVNGKVTMLLSHPALEEIDISEYVIGR